MRKKREQRISYGVDWCLKVVPMANWAILPRDCRICVQGVSITTLVTSRTFVHVLLVLISCAYLQILDVIRRSEH